jgi:hypothetical protein
MVGCGVDGAVGEQAAARIRVATSTPERCGIARYYGSVVSVARSWSI